jgi:thiol-disulfide isomerase/thioredoxin
MIFRKLPFVIAAILATAACAAQPQPKPAAPEVAAPVAAPAPEEGVLVGPVTREKVEASPEWVQAEVEAKPDPNVAAALASVPPGAEVEIFLGTWCGDSRREVPRFWKAVDAAGGAVPFQVHYVGVDHAKKEPAAEIAREGVRYLPTFIVRRGGHEVGRIVETSPNGIESDLLALLTGKASGVLSTRTDLSPSKP